jgi:hypothetical protein
MAARLDVFHFAWVNVSLVAWPASVAIRIVLALGVYLMVAKPESVESLIVLTLALALGAVAAKRTRPAIRVSSGDAPAAPQLACEQRPDDRSRGAERTARVVARPAVMPFHARANHRRIE